MIEELIKDVAPFADLGTSPPSLVGPQTLVFYRLGAQTTLEFGQSGSIVEKYEDQSNLHASIGALLASQRFGDLGNWASQQLMVLDQEARVVGSLLETRAYLNDSINLLDLDGVSDLLANAGHRLQGSSAVALIDGPAGIGKTHFIATLALKRAREFSQRRQALILHVESRGRVLTALHELIAFSLQRLRLRATYDQIPVLVKHGLVILAIDGFDELADPSGYNLAWKQVNDLVVQIRGLGQLILAGRETFIGRRRVFSDIGTLRDGVDRVDTFRMEPPTTQEAFNWLRNEGWSDGQLEHVKDLFERGSLALRPFFIKKLAEPAVATAMEQSQAGGQLALLTDALVRREAGKFGEEVESALTEIERQNFVRAMMVETAMLMADGESDSIDDTTLAWLVEACLPRPVEQRVEFLLKNRSQVLGFLTNDQRPRFLRFFHEKFFEYFLSIGLFNAINNGEVRKCISRNNFGSSFLETFGATTESAFDRFQVAAFLQSALSILEVRASFDKTRGNIAAFILATAHLSQDFEGEIEIHDVEVSETRIVGTIEKLGCRRVLFAQQMDIRGANLDKIQFVDCTILFVLADAASLVSESMPSPERILDVADGVDDDLRSQEQRLRWMRRHFLRPPEEDSNLIPIQLRDHPAILLLSKACRIRQYWLRAGDDKYADRILSSEDWPIIERYLAANDLIVKELRPASGTDATFVHIRHAFDILTQDQSNPGVLPFYRDLVAELAN